MLISVQAVVLEVGVKTVLIMILEQVKGLYNIGASIKLHGSFITESGKW